MEKEAVSEFRFSAEPREANGCAMGLCSFNITVQHADKLQEALVSLVFLLWTFPFKLPWTIMVTLPVTRSKLSKETRLNEYFQHRCINYERFLCDRVWECAECARQSVKVEQVEGSTLPIVTHLRRR